MSRPITINDLTDLVIEGIELMDYPHFVDAYVAAAWHVREDRPLTEEELDEFNMEEHRSVQALALDKSFKENTR
jgi:hypothetical protein